MEREADEFSHKNLPKFDISPAAFADAMTLLVKSHSNSDDPLNDDDEKQVQNSLNHWLQYLSTHPDTQERIDSARNAEGN